jgi:organic hydroperoxide reductase OsmC/OhrA
MEWREMVAEQHIVKLDWRRGVTDFDYESYSRNHTVTFGPGTTIRVSSAPEFFGDPASINPEQAFVTALASCHLLTFLALASKKGFIIDSYGDDAHGEIGKNEAGRTAMVKVHLRPQVVFSGAKIPSIEEFNSLHDRAHRGCIIANSVASFIKVIVDPVMHREMSGPTSVPS